MAEKRYKRIVEMMKRADQREKELNESFDPSTGAYDIGSGQAKTSMMNSGIYNVDDLDVSPICELDDPETRTRINIFVAQANGTTNNPWRIIKAIQYKLHIAGLNFKIPQNPEMPSEPITYEFELMKHGGDFGPMPSGEWKNDVGFDEGYIIRFDIEPNEDYTWDLHAEVLPDHEAEGGESFNEGFIPNFLKRKNRNKKSPSTAHKDLKQLSVNKSNITKMVDSSWDSVYNIISKINHLDTGYSFKTGERDIFLDNIETRNWSVEMFEREMRNIPFGKKMSTDLIHLLADLSYYTLKRSDTNHDFKNNLKSSIHDQIEEIE